MLQFRCLVIQLLALIVLADAFALGREQTSARTETSDTEPDQTPSGSAAQHITKISRSKDKVQNKYTKKTVETTTAFDIDDKIKEAADISNEIQDKTAKPIEPASKAHGPGQDEAAIAVASNGSNDVTQTVNETDTPIELTSVVTNTTSKGNKESDDPNWISEAVTEVNGDIITDNATVTLTSVDSESNYSTASVNDNEDSANVTTDNLKEKQHTRETQMLANVTELKEDITALVAEGTQADTTSAKIAEEPFQPYQGTTSQRGRVYEMTSQGGEAFEDKLTSAMTIQEQEAKELQATNAISTDTSSISQSNSRTTEWLLSPDELTTAIANTNYDKVITKEERIPEMSTAGNEVEPTSNAETTSTVVPKSPPVMEENEGPLDDVTMGTSNSWRREDTVVTSMRGGYLNHSPEVHKDAATKSDVTRSVEENQPELRNTQAVASQSQMIDDQIKDVLIMEDRLSEGLKRGEERPLSVRPIAKNSTLYTVSPNYKPMPKLDVVPGKPQLRDPDDNSWRNQSLNNLGIVFKGHNSSKPFTQVLKNKTETELSNLVERDDKTEAPELRERLEKLAEERKSKKKKGDKNGESADYDDPSTYFYKTTTHNPTRATSDGPGLRPTVPKQPNERKVSPHRNIFNHYDYESRDDDIDYVTLPYIDLQKAPTTKTPDRATTRFPTTRNWAQPTMRGGAPRKATVQYFPPRVYMKNDTEQDDFHRKMEAFEPEIDAPITTANLVLKDKEPVYNQPQPTNFYLPDTPKPDLTPPYQVPANKAYSFRDIMTKIGHEDDYDRINEYVPLQKVKEVLTQREHAHFGKAAIEKFMQNYNDNSKRFRVDYPVVYNSRVLHSDGIGGVGLPASSSASVKQQYYNSGDGKHILEERKKCDPNCEKIVELSADYELHYYMPDQEERLELGRITK